MFFVIAQDALRRRAGCSATAAIAARFHAHKSGGPAKTFRLQFERDYPP